MSLFQPKKRKRWFDKLTINKNEKNSITTIIIIALKTSWLMVEQTALGKKFEKVAITMAKNTPFLTLYR